MRCLVGEIERSGDRSAGLYRSAGHRAALAGLSRALGNSVITHSKAGRYAGRDVQRCHSLIAIAILF